MGGLEILRDLNERCTNKPQKFEFFLEIDWKSSFKSLKKDRPVYLQKVRYFPGPFQAQEKDSGPVQVRKKWT